MSVTARNGFGVVIIACAALGTVRAADPPAAVPPPANQRTLAILVDFDDMACTMDATTLKTNLFGSAGSVASYWDQVSDGRIKIAGDVVGPYHLGFKTAAGTSYSTGTDWAAAADAAASKAGVDVASYGRLIYVVPPNSLIGGTDAAGKSVWLSAWGEIEHKTPTRIFAASNRIDATVGPAGVQVLAHEVGHTLGLSHSLVLNRNEVCDTSCVMGSAPALLHINAPHKVGLGWIPAANVRTVTQDGTYVVALCNAPRSEVQVLRIPEASGSSLYVSYRRPVGLDATGLPADFADRTSVHRWSGVMNDGGQVTYLCGTAGDGGTVSVGSAGERGVRITQVSHDATHATIAVSLATVSERNAPGLSVSGSVPQSVPRAGHSSVTLKAIVTNHDLASAPSTRFSLRTACPKGWKAEPVSFDLAPGAVKECDLTLRKDPSVSPGAQTFTVTVEDASITGHLATATATCLVEDGKTHHHGHGKQGGREDGAVNERASSTDWSEYSRKLVAAAYRQQTGEDLPPDAGDLDKAWKKFEAKGLAHRTTPEKGALVFYAKPFSEGDRKGHLAVWNGDGTVLSGDRSGACDPALDEKLLGGRLGWVDAPKTPVVKAPTTPPR